MKAYLSLPPNYARATMLEPSKQPAFIIGATLAGITFLLVTGWLLVLFADALRPTALDGMRLRDLFSSTSTGSSFVIPPAVFRNLALALIAVVIVHELVHGLGYWLFSRQRPRFGVQGLFPYAAAPSGVYFPRNDYILIGLAPLVLLTVVGLVLMVTAPIAWVPFLVCFVAFNASGAAGDVIMVLQLLACPADTVMEDNGSGVIVYRLKEDR